MARIAFVQNIAFEYLGVMYISSILKKYGHSAEAFVVGGNEDKVVEEIVGLNPQVVGFSCTTGAHIWALAFAEKIKKRLPCKIIFGGAHATYFPEIINEKAVDIICRGEGELPLLEIANKIDKNIDISDTLNCWFKVDGQIVRNEQRDLIENLDDLPFPDRELYIKRYPYLKRSQKAFIGRRGCPFSCTFCFNHAWMNLYKGKGRVVRYRSVDNLIAEIKEAKNRFGLKTAYMQDDTFILDKKWLEEFSDKYKKEINLPFICLIRADLADEEIIRMLFKAGCKNVFFGIESGSEKIRNSILKKNISDDQIRNTAALLHKYGIRFRTYNMLGLPGETLNDAFKTVGINIEIKTDFPWCAIFHPFPGTELARYAQEKGFFDSASDTANPSFFKDSVIKSEHKRELVNLQKLFLYAVKFPNVSGIIRRLIRCRPNFVFDLVFLLGYAWSYLFSENLTLKEMFSLGIRNVRRFFWVGSKFV